MSITIKDNDSDTAVLPERIRGFPWPFSADNYRYSANVEPARKTVKTEAGAWGGELLNIDEHYLEEIKERDGVLDRDCLLYTSPSPRDS